MSELDAKAREEFDTRLHGWDEINTRGDAMLRRPAEDDDPSGGES